MSSTIELKLSTQLSYPYAGAFAPTPDFESAHQASTRKVAALLESVYALAGELRALGPEAHRALPKYEGRTLSQRLDALTDVVAMLHSDLATLRAPLVQRQLEALGIDERSRNLKLHIGSGGHDLSGWINIDNHPAPLALNLNWGLPFADQSARYVYSAHLLEHLFYPDEACWLLEEIARVLKPGGVVRIVVPDIEAYCRAYVSGDASFFATRTEHWGSVGPGSTLLENFLHYAGAASAPAELFESHKFGFDFDTLKCALERSGFVNVRRCSYQASPHEALRVDDASSNARVKCGEQYLSLFVEAAKPT